MELSLILCQSSFQLIIVTQKAFGVLFLKSLLHRPVPVGDGGVEHGELPVRRSLLRRGPERAGLSSRRCQDRPSDSSASPCTEGKARTTLWQILKAWCNLWDNV